MTCTFGSLPCRHPKCYFRAHSSRRFGGFCSGACRKWFNEHGRNRPVHGRSCEQEPYEPGNEVSCAEPLELEQAAALPGLQHCVVRNNTLIQRAAAEVGRCLERRSSNDVTFGWGHSECGEAFTWKKGSPLESCAALLAFMDLAMRTLSPGEGLLERRCEGLRRLSVGARRCKGNEHIMQQTERDWYEEVVWMAVLSRTERCPPMLYTDCLSNQYYHEPERPGSVHRIEGGARWHWQRGLRAPGQGEERLAVTWRWFRSDHQKLMQEQLSCHPGNDMAELERMLRSGPDFSRDLLGAGPLDDAASALCPYLTQYLHGGSELYTAAHLLRRPPSPPWTTRAASHRIPWQTQLRTRERLRHAGARRDLPERVRYFRELLCVAGSVQESVGNSPGGSCACGRHPQVPGPRAPALPQLEICAGD